MKKLAVLLALALAVTLVAPVASATSSRVATHTTLSPIQRVGRHHNYVWMLVGAQHWSPRQHEWLGSRGQYVKIQVWRNGAWHYRGYVRTLSSNNPHWAIKYFQVFSPRPHSYRAVTPPSFTRRGSHSVIRTK